MHGRRKKGSPCAISAGKGILRQAAEGGLSEAGGKGAAGFVHGRNHAVQADEMRTTAAESETGGVHGLDGTDGIALDARHLNQPAAAMEHATPTSPWQPTSAPEIEAFVR